MPQNRKNNPDENKSQENFAQELINNNPQLKGIPREQQLLLISQQMSGPLPPPDMLQGYEKIAKGTAQKMIQMAEN